MRTAAFSKAHNLSCEEDKTEPALHIEDVATPNEPPSPLHLRDRNACTSPLLRLPRELRDVVIHHAITTHPAPLSSQSSQLPALLGTSSQLRVETAEIFYARKLILAGGAPSPQYEKAFFDGFDPDHLRFVKRVHWLWDSYGTAEQAMRRAGELDALTGLRKGTWTVGFIDVFEHGRGKAVYVNCEGSVRAPEGL
jgi:hypothetical protein